MISLLKRVLGFPRYLFEVFIGLLVFCGVMIIGCAIAESFSKYGDEAIEFSDQFMEDAGDPLMDEAPLYYFDFDPEECMYLGIHDRWESIREQASARRRSE